VAGSTPVAACGTSVISKFSGTNSPVMSRVGSFIGQFLVGLVDVVEASHFFDAHQYTGALLKWICGVLCGRKK
jgi:hypothetical protein